jgi:hypothetical protein
VVLVVDHCLLRSVPAARHFWLDQGDLGHRIDRLSLHRHLWIFEDAIFGYLIFQGRGMAERNVQQAQQAREELRRVVGFSVADEIQKLDGLKKAGSISDAEFATLRARLVQ